MELNESLAKVDLNLDSTVKKIEKQSQEYEKKHLLVEMKVPKQSPDGRPTERPECINKK